MHTQQEKQKKAWWPFVLAALMFGTMLALGRKIQFSGDVHASYTHNAFDDFAWTDLAVFAAAAVGAFVLLLAVDRLYDAFARPLKRKTFDKKLFVFVLPCCACAGCRFFSRIFRAPFWGIRSVPFSRHSETQRFPIIFPLYTRCLWGFFSKLALQ